MVVIGLAGILFLVFWRQQWSWVEMSVLAVVVVVGVLRSLKGGG